MKKYLILGCGTLIEKRISVPPFGDHPGSPEKDFIGQTTTVDHLPAVNADICADLNDLPYDWVGDEEYDEIHAYEILEHCGTQGDADFFFGQFNEFWRILKPNGLMMLSVPMWTNSIAFGVPDHKRVMPACLFQFLFESYYDNLGNPGFGDYRSFIKGYWRCFWGKESESRLELVLIKC